MGRRLHRHTSPLYDILNSTGIHTNNLETVNTTTKHPMWCNHVKTIIAKTREEAEQLAKDDESDIRIYTDGSSHDGGVGAVAVLMQGIHPVKIAKYHLGRDTKHTVYESECTSQILALKMLQKLGQDLDGQPSCPLVIQCKESHPRQLPHQGCKGPNQDNRGEMAEGQVEAPVGTRTRRNQRERESRQGGQTSGRRRIHEPQAQAPPPPEGPTSQQIGDQTAPQEEGLEGIQKGVPHVTKIRKVIPIQPQITSIQLHEDRDETYQTSGKHLSSAAVEPCPSSGILAPF